MQNSNYSIHCGSCTDPLLYPAVLADIIIFDPPFWPYKTSYKQVRETNLTPLSPILTPDPEHYYDWWEAVCQIALAHLKPQGWFVFKSDSWMAKMAFALTMKYFKYSNEVRCYAEDEIGPDGNIPCEEDLTVDIGDVVWDKKCIGLGRRIRTRHEQVEVYVHPDKCAKYWGGSKLNSYWRVSNNLSGESTKYKTKGWHGSSRGKAFPSVIVLPSKRNGMLGSSAEHINETPPELWEPFIQFMCPPGGLILDLTAGTGSIGSAVKRLNYQSHAARKEYWGIEISPEYVALAAGNLGIGKLPHGQHTLVPIPTTKGEMA